MKDTIKRNCQLCAIGWKERNYTNIIKQKWSENLIETSDLVKEISKEMQTNEFPKDLKVTITGDQSISTRAVFFNDLINSIIIDSCWYW